jgi:hypothetical protein
MEGEKNKKKVKKNKSERIYMLLMVDVIEASITEDSLKWLHQADP